MIPAFIMIDTLTIVMAGHSRPKDGVAEPVLGLAEGKTRGLAYVPAIHAFGSAKKEVRRGCHSRRNREHARMLEPYRG